MSGKSLKALFALGLGVALAVACGGRSVTTEGDGAGGDSGNAGVGASSGGGGRPSGGTGNIGTAGSNAVAGGPSIAGSSNGCDPTACKSIACGVNETPAFLPGACCPVCMPNCLGQACPDIACASGYQLQTLPGQCCPTCVPTPTVDCATGQKAYFSLRMQLEEKYQFGCSAAKDCVVGMPINACEPGCSYVAISLAAYADWESGLSSEADKDCANCAPTPTPSCPPPAGSCINGQCVLSTQ